MRSFFLFLVFFIPQILIASTVKVPQLDFNSALEQIILRNTEIQVQQATLRVIEAKNIPSRLFYLPQVTLTGRIPVGAAASVFPMQRQFEINSQWNLLRWGADLSALKAAQQEEATQRYTLHQSCLHAEKDAVQSLLLRIQSAKEVEIHEAIVAHQLELSKIAHERYRAGYLSIQEVEKIMVDLANAQAALMDSNVSALSAEVALESRLGTPHIQMEWPWVDTLKNIHSMAWKAFQDKIAISSRPDWLAAESKVEYLNALVVQNSRLLLPSVDLQFSYGYYSGYFGSATGWTGYLSLSFPIFDQLTRYSRIQQQVHLRSSSEAQFEQTRRKAQLEWDTARRSFQMARESALSREETLKLSRKLYADNQRRFQVGRITSNDLAIDRNRMYQAELNAVQGWSGVHLLFTGLCHSLGLRVQECWAMLQ